MTVACSSPKSTTSPASSSAARSKDRPLLQDVSLVTLRSTEAPPTDVPVIAISTRALRLDRSPSLSVPLPPPNDWESGFTAEHKAKGRKGLLIKPLGQAIKRLTESGVREVIIAPDGRIPYRIIVEAMYSVLTNGCRRVYFMVRSPQGDLKTVPIATPPTPDTHTAPSRLYGGTVTIAPEGVRITPPKGIIGAKCKKGAEGPAVAMNAGEPDYRALRSCAVLLKTDAALKDNSNVTLGAPGTTPFAVIAKALDALRMTEDDRVLLPRIQLGISM